MVNKDKYKKALAKINSVMSNIWAKYHEIEGVELSNNQYHELFIFIVCFADMHIIHNNIPKDMKDYLVYAINMNILENSNDTAYFKERNSKRFIQYLKTYIDGNGKEGYRCMIDGRSSYDYTVFAYTFIRIISGDDKYPYEETTSKFQYMDWHKPLAIHIGKIVSATEKIDKILRKYEQWGG